MRARCSPFPETGPSKAAKASGLAPARHPRPLAGPPAAPSPLCRAIWPMQASGKPSLGGGGRGAVSRSEDARCRSRSPDGPDYWEGLPWASAPRGGPAGPWASLEGPPPACPLGAQSPGLCQLVVTPDGAGAAECAFQRPHLCQSSRSRELVPATAHSWGRHSASPRVGSWT